MSQRNFVIFAVSAGLGFTSATFAGDEPAYNPTAIVEIVGTVTAVRQVLLPAVLWKAFI